MISGNVNEFVEKISLGDELYFKLDGKCYFFEGWNTDDNKGWVALYEVEDKPAGKIIATLFENSSDSLKECSEKFLNAPLFNGKTFWECQSEIEWIDI